MSAPKTILVLGTNAGQADLIRYMKDHGWRVVACAHRSGGPGEAHCDLFERVDIRDVPAVTNLARRVQADLVYSVSSDVANATAIAVSEALNSPHFFDSDLVDLCNRKQRFRAHLDKAGLSPVAYREVSTLEDASGWSQFPCIVKPTNSQGQRGVQRVDRVEDLALAVQNAADVSMTDAVVIIEEFLEGIEVCCNTLVRDRHVVVHELSERLVNSGALSFISRGHLIPCYSVSEQDQQAARQLVRDVVRSLDVRDGCFYFQIKITPRGPRIVEIAPRVDGGHLWRLMKASCGIDFLDETMKCLLGQRSDIIRRVPDGTHEMMFFQMPPGEPLHRSDFPVPANALYHEYRYAEGETVLPVNGHWEVVGYYLRPVTTAEAATQAGSEAF